MHQATDLLSELHNQISKFWLGILPKEIFSEVQDFTRFFRVFCLRTWLGFFVGLGFFFFSFDIDVL